MKKKISWPISTSAVEIEWLDHSGGTGWAKPEKYQSDRLSLCRTVGYVISEDRDQVTLMQSQDATYGNVQASMIISKRLILRRRRLE